MSTAPVSWNRGEARYDFILSAPTRPGRYPLVIYLPGLGESRSAGEVWRNSWAQAGYAVLSIQLLEEDGRIWESRGARNGDFLPLVRARYASDVVGKRQEALRGLLTELQHRRTSDPLLANVDLNTLIFAGFDLGAQTSLIAAGEQVAPRGSNPSENSLPRPAAVILLSPHADFSGRAFDDRYSKLSVPILSVTGHGDTDAFGLVTSVTLRTAPFQHMPPGGKYLLMLEDTSHSLIGGESLAQRSAREGIRPSGSPGGDRESGGNDRQGGGGPGGPDNGGGRGGRRGPGNNGGDGFGGGQAETGMGWGKNQSVIKAVTTAFLDQQVKQDSFAEEWMRKDARRWLRDMAELTVR